jgi:hypothetical protein
MGHSQFHPLRQHIAASPAGRPAGTPDIPAADDAASPEAAEELQPAPASV